MLPRSEERAIQERHVLPLHLNCFRIGLSQNWSFAYMCNSRNRTQEVFMERKPRNENWGVPFLRSKVTERP